MLVALNKTSISTDTVRKIPTAYLLTRPRGVLSYEFLCRRLFPTQSMKQLVWAVGVLTKLSDEMFEDANKQQQVKKEGKSEQDGHNNFLKLFINAHNRETGKRLSKDEVKAQVFTLLLAGYETTANTLAQTIYMLCKNKDKEQAQLPPAAYRAAAVAQRRRGGQAGPRQGPAEVYRHRQGYR